MIFKTLSLTVIAMTILVSLPAQAHGLNPLEGSSFFAGLLHPIMGLDHLVAMLAIGVWAAQQKQALRIQIPCVFLILLSAGFILGQGAFGLPMIEGGIATSVLLLGILIATAARLPRSAALTLTGLFALFHGNAHGIEAATASAVAFATGLLLCSTLLQLSGFFVSKQWKQVLPRLSQITGLIIAATGISLLAA